MAQSRRNPEAYGLDRLFEKALGSRLFPGAILTVATGGKMVFKAAWGGVTHVPWSARVSPCTVYDLASLTKPLVTALSVMALIERGKLHLDDTLGSFLSEVPLDKIQISIRHLLCHISGLPAYRPFYKELIHLAPDSRLLEMKKLLLAEPLVSPPGTQAGYSDLGFMLLGWIIENLTGKCLADAAQELVFEPLNVKGLYFSLTSTQAIGQIFPGPPLIKGEREDLKNRCCDGLVAPTEVCPFRKRVVCGEVHDLNAWVIGGVSGHAGLFGTAGSVARLLMRLLDIYKGRSNVPNFPKGLLQEFWHIQGSDTGSTWALGFDTPSPAGSSAGSSFSPQSIGHLGFTGTSFWMDLEHEILVVFLANRTFPKVDRESQAEMRQFRPLLHDLIKKIWGIG
ncbi:MAG: serine hydrolase domain-containing protein [Thermodesulfobacteriota bacterium]|nr:serine hydrolase domain-containing protein [Thermodesulfobacteriota bacterium]